MGFSADAFDFLDCLVDTRLVCTDIVDNEVEAIASQAEGNCFANTSGTSGNLLRHELKVLVYRIMSYLPPRLCCWQT